MVRSLQRPDVSPNPFQIETLPTRNTGVQPLQNVLSVSTAGKNRYLLHFNSLHSLTQWTAGIRLAMFENASLQELYTGSLIAGKGRQLNSINQIMTKNKFRIEDWARVRFGAGTPWRRCWCVIEPPDEKEWQKSQKKLGKRSAYEKVTYPKGDIKFYDTKKIKKALPIATITDAYSAYAIYPQSKPLINESTLVKLEGKITIHSQPESKTEGFVFVMPEVHPAVSGFEMMLRWLLPVYDTFSLYGRPNRLIPDTLDTRSLMFAMPKERRYGYLDIIDISTLIHSEGSDKWTEREWRKRMKEAVSRRMAMQVQGRASNIEGVRNNPNARSAVQFSDSASTHSSHRRNESTDAVFETPKKTHTAPAQIASNYHSRSASGNISMATPKRVRDPLARERTPTRLSEEYSPAQSQQNLSSQLPQQRYPLRPRINDAGYMDSANSSDSEIQGHINADDVEHDMIQHKPVQPVVAPPSFNHQPNEQPRKRPADRPELRREKSRMSDATLSQMNPRVLEEIRQEGIAREQNMQGGGPPASTAAMHAWRQNGDQSQSRGVNNETPADEKEIVANSQRPAVVTNTSSTSIQSLTKRKPVAAVAQDPTNDSRPSNPRQQSETSNYSMQNQERDPSPDYASQSSQRQPSERSKSRGGMRKIIGDPESQKAPDIEPLHIDFGYTQRLTPENSEPSYSRPTTATGLRSPFEALGLPETSTGRDSPSEVYGPHPAGRKSPLNPLPLTPPNRTPEKQKQNQHERFAHSRSQSQTWYPGPPTTAGPEGGVSAEEFVQQRFAVAKNTRNYVPWRTTSAGRVEQLKNDQPPQSPPSPQAKSPKKLQKRALENRNSSGSSIDYTAHLSAREREHVARMTGGTLLNMDKEQGRIPDPKVGLIGAISAREQERRNIKEGLQGHMVQAAIDQQKREARSRQMQAFHQRSQSQSMMQQQYQNLGTNPYQNPYEYPAQSEYGLQQVASAQQQPYWSQMQSQYPSQQASQWRPQRPGMPQQQQSAPAVPQLVPGPIQPQPRPQIQQAGSVRPESMIQQGYPAQQYPVQPQYPAQQQYAPSTHGRSQSVYSQLTGFYAPRR